MADITTASLQAVSVLDALLWRMAKKMPFVGNVTEAVADPNTHLRGRPVLENVMEALADPNTHLIGVYGSDDKIKDALLQIVNRRIQRDDLFDPVLTATITGKLVTRKPDVKRIQNEIAHQVGLTFNHKSKDKRAQELIERIKTEQKIVIVLRDVHKGLDLGKVGIPYGSDHTGCKILFTSTAEGVLSTTCVPKRISWSDDSIC